VTRQKTIAGLLLLLALIAGSAPLRAGDGTVRRFLVGSAIAHAGILQNFLEGPFASKLLWYAKWSTPRAKPQLMSAIARVAVVFTAVRFKERP
jgi:hypothetical protein